MTERVEESLRDLYIRLYFDEDVAVGVAINLRTRGFDVLFAREAPMLRRSDDEQLSFATAQRRTIVTHNRVDFEARHAAILCAGQRHFGVIIAKRRRTEGEVVARLLRLLDSTTVEEVENQLRYI